MKGGVVMTNFDFVEALIEEKLPEESSSRKQILIDRVFDSGSFSSDAEFDDFYAEEIEELVDETLAESGY